MQHKIVESRDGYKWYIENKCDYLVFNDGEFIVFEFLKNISDKSKVFVDVGAFVGAFSIRMSRYYGKVYAFEPNPRSYRVLKKNIELNNIQNIQAYNIGVGDSRRQVTLYEKGGSSSIVDDSYKRGEYKVWVDRLDRLVDRVDVLKIDVEGYEGYVIKGALNLIHKYNPIIVIEHHEYRGYDKIPIKRKDIEKMLSPYIVLNLDEVHYAYIPRHKDLLKYSFAVCCHWFNHTIKNLEEQRAWYHGLPYTFWYGGNPLSFYLALKHHLRDQLTWIDRIEFDNYTPPALNLDFDWDWLIVLDACRYDLFKRYWIYSKVYPRMSWASCTVEFHNKLKPIPNSIIITGHPFLLNKHNLFSKIIDVGFDYDLNTVHPSRINNYVTDNITSIMKYRKKILWYMQPHHPHIAKPKLDIGIYKDIEEKDYTPQQKVTEMFMRAKQDGLLLKSYTANLQLVINYIKNIIDYLLKNNYAHKIVIISDHGEGLGEPYREKDKPIYSHPCNREEYELKIIPFTVIQK